MLSDLNGEHGHVVVLGGVADEGEDVRFDVVEQIGGVFVAVLYDGAGELFEAPLFGFGVHGFGDAIGVGNDEVAGLELYVSGFGDGAEGGVVDEPDGDAWGFGAVDLILLCLLIVPTDVRQAAVALPRLMRASARAALPLPLRGKDRVAPLRGKRLKPPWSLHCCS